MEFGILGALEVRPSGPLPPKARALLAMLLCEPGAPVSVDRLADALWDGSPPPSAAYNVRTYVHQVRRAIGDDRIVRVPPGYAVVVRPGELDVERFEELVADGKLKEALALWRGPALDGFDFLYGERQRLEERRLAVHELHMEAELAAGEHARAVPELTALVTAHPLRERFRAQLMLALYRSGRQAAALQVYSETRALLVAELGIEPGTELRELERMILSEETVPGELPLDIADFTGRDAEVAGLVDDLRRGGLLAISGRPGVGKSALAVHVAHRTDFPDGQLFASLKGAPPGRVLARFLRALGVEGTAIPDGVEERAALFRSRLSGRRVLVVLDDAADEGQVRPLVPGNAGCAVLVTSRRRLSGLEGARHAEIEVFEPEWAVDLLAGIAGAARVRAEPEAAAEIVRLCGRLPLAVRIAAARLAARPLWSLSRFAVLLSDERRRLSELAVGDLEVRASLALSREGLSRDARAAFPLLALLDQPWIPAFAAHAVCPPGVVEELVDARLLDEVAEDRYHFHDLTRLYAAEHDLSPGVRRAALERALGAWLEHAERADAGLPSHGMEPVTERRHVEPVEDALAWFDAERAALVAAIALACESGLAGLAWRLCAAFAGYLDFRNHFDDWEQTHRMTLEACREAGDPLGEAVALRGLAGYLIRGPQQVEGVQVAGRAREIFAGLGHARGEADALMLIGQMHRMRAEVEEGTAALRECLALAERHGFGPAEVAALWELGLISVYRERTGEAVELFLRMRDLAAGAGMIRQRAIALRGLGLACTASGDLDEAERHLLAGKELLRGTGDTLNEAHLDITLGAVYIAQGDPRARGLLEEVLEVIRATNHNQWCAAEAVAELGVLALAEGDAQGAVERLREALALYRTTRMPYYEAKTLSALADACAAAGDHEAADLARRQAKELAGPLFR
ncbi:BTAD domain-containing putative transcriptional regulator [Nonomuraea sp. NPDC050556]|uniref:AfsR/SARP family transcriptional regulator n=1 Tax=Nonomuraea sp. NPDC050556 TaxID=3364369 RepID=UPI003789EF1B